MLRLQTSQLALKVHASSSDVAARDEVFQCAASIVSIAAGALLRRSSLPFVPRGELRDLPYLDRSGRSRDRRDHQFPLQREAFDRPCDETRSRSRALWQDANRMAIGNHALHPVLSFRAEARPHHDLSTGEVLPSTHDVSSRKSTRERVRPRRLALITSQRQVSQQLTDGAISIGAFPLSFVCSQPRPSPESRYSTYSN